MRTFMIFKQITPPARQPYRLIETIMTSDGLRSRICNGTWKTEAEAATEARTRAQNLGASFNA